MINKKVLTLIIPTYNMEKYLHKCLDSLVISERNMEYVEILVINDGSKDASSEIAHKFETRYPKSFRVIDKDNGNYGSCINRGIWESTGKYIKILDADDSFVTGNFDLFIDFLLSTDSDLIINDYCSVNEKGEILENYNFPLPLEGFFTLDDMSEKTIGWLAMHGITHKKSNLLKMNYKQLEGIPYTDEQWVVEPTAFSEKISYFPHDLYLYLIGREGQTVDPKILKKNFSKRIVVIKSLITFFSLNENSCSVSSKRYLTYKIRDKIDLVYRFYLLKSGIHKNLSELIEFDKFLKETSPELYRLSEECTNVFSQYYIKKWRASEFRQNRFVSILYLIKQNVERLFVDNTTTHMPLSDKRHE